MKTKLYKKIEVELLELKTSSEIEKAELIEDAKKSAATSILESMVKMANEVQAKGFTMDSWNSAAWSKKLKILKGEEVIEVEEAGTSGVAKEAGESEAAKVKETGDEGNDAKA